MERDLSTAGHQPRGPAPENPRGADRRRWALAGRAGSLRSALPRGAPLFRTGAHHHRGARPHGGDGPHGLSQLKLNCRALVEKLALEEVRTYSYTRGRTYLVYHAEEVVRRRRAAGLTHVIKTRGVVFVDPETGAERTQKRHVKTTPLVS